MMIVGYGNLRMALTTAGICCSSSRAKRYERDYELDEVICEPLLGRASVQLMSFPMLHGCHGPIVSNAPTPDLPTLAPAQGRSTLSRRSPRLAAWRVVLQLRP
jgi:hypothetical protein